MKTVKPQTIRRLPQTRSGWQEDCGDQSEDHQFVAMLDGYRPSGGLAACPELLGLCRRHCGADGTILARWIVERAVVSFEWQSQTWFPLFQFRATNFTPSARLRPLLAQLSENYNPWSAAHWFVIPNPRLGGRVPVSLLDTDLGAVLAAAQPTALPGEMRCAMN